MPILHRPGKRNQELHTPGIDHVYIEAFSWDAATRRIEVHTGSGTTGPEHYPRRLISHHPKTLKATR